MNVDDYLKSIKPAAQRSALAPFHADLLKLRTSGCTLSQISDFLRMHGVSVTLSTIAKYLRKQFPQRVVTAEKTVVTTRTTQESANDAPVASSLQAQPDADEAHASREPPGLKSVEQLREENPTLPSIQITKMYAQQYAGPAIDSQQLEEIKRRYGSPQIRR
ncbi:HMG-box domain-containing protein [Paraburkholderia tropica]|uniref:hypothetical protein n=1 Tax=Paraburkholderia tropica TaxID=92647 RepID=UPI002AB6DD51|nr:hypothetical protein [Paraburkholderia tropica]